VLVVTEDRYMFCATSDNAPFPVHVRQLCVSCLRSFPAEHTRVFVGSRNRTNSALVFGIVLSYLWLIHRLWLRSVFSEDHKPTVDTKIAGGVGNFSGSNLGWPGKMVVAQIGCRTMKARTE
jgi:hypothetical protein